MVKVKEDLIGKQFERLTVLRQAEDYISKKGKKEAQWLVSCSCDNKEFIVLQSSLKQGKTISCGCFRKEKISNLKRKYNQYFEEENYMVGILNNQHKFYFDKDDYEKVKKYYWQESNGYIISIINNNKTILLHRLIMNAKNNETVDHIYHKL